MWFYNNVLPQHLALYIIVLAWKGHGFRFTPSMLLKETCNCDDKPAVDLDRISRPGGIQVLINEIKKFRRAKINYYSK